MRVYHIATILWDSVSDVTLLLWLTELQDRFNAIRANNTLQDILIILFLFTTQQHNNFDIHINNYY